MSLMLGLSVQTILRVLEKYSFHQHLRIRLNTKAPLRPIFTNQIMGRVQIDLMDMQKVVTSYQGKRRNYILSVLDVFSRYVWQRAVDKKSSSVIRQQLKDIFEA